MKLTHKLLTIALASILWLTNATAVDWSAEDTWDPTQNAYVIPSGETHTTSYIITLSQDMIVEGTFEIKTELTNDSTINIETGGTVACIGHPGYLHNGCNSTGIININGGTLSTDSSFVEFKNGYEASGIINLNSGIITISLDSFENGYNENGTINIYSGTMSIDTTFENGYSLGGQGAINIYGGNFNISNENFFNGGSSNGVINVSGGNLSTSFASLYNGSYGTINLTSGNINYSELTLYNVSGVINVSGGDFNFDNAILANGWSSGHGTINLSGGNINIDNNSTIKNGEGGDGTLNINGGNLNLNSSGEFENGYGKPGIVNLNSGNFNNNGGDFFNGVNDPGTVNFNGGNFNSNSSGTFYNGYSDVGILNVNSDTYVYNTIKNGIGSNSGYINVNYSGNIFILGGKIENDTNGNIDVYAGGSLYNYHGTIDTDLGTFDIHASGKFENSRGNYPSTITVNGGGNFIDSHEIHLDKDLDIDYTWTVTDKVSIDGNGNEITFGPSGGILLEGADAQLSLDDVILNDVSGNKIRCTNTNARLLINNVIWNQDADYTFTLGQIFVSGDWLITGRGTNFNYESDATSTLSSNSIIHLLETTFNYNQAADDDLIEMIDGTSRFHLEFGTILASENWYLSNGTILTTGLGTLKGEALLDAQDLSKIKIAGSFRRVGNVLT